MYSIVVIRYVDLEYNLVLRLSHRVFTHSVLGVVPLVGNTFYRADS